MDRRNNPMEGTQVNRTSIIQHRMRLLEAELKELSRFGEDVYADGTVIKFKYRYSQNGCACPEEAVCVHARRRRQPPIRNDRGEYVAGPTVESPWYTFYACKIKGGWYLSGKSSARIDWDELVAMWTDGEVRKMRIATGWAKLDGTVTD